MDFKITYLIVAMAKTKNYFKLDIIRVFLIHLLYTLILNKFNGLTLLIIFIFYPIAFFLSPYFHLQRKTCKPIFNSNLSPDFKLSYPCLLLQHSTQISSLEFDLVTLQQSHLQFALH